MSLMNDVLKELEKNKNRQVPGIAQQKPRVKKRAKLFNTRTIVHIASITAITCSALIGAIIIVHHKSLHIKAPTQHALSKKKTSLIIEAASTMPSLAPQERTIAAQQVKVAQVKPTTAQLYHALSHDLDSVVGLSLYDKDMIPSKPSGKSVPTTPTQQPHAEKIKAASLTSKTLTPDVKNTPSMQQASNARIPTITQNISLAKNWLDTSPSDVTPVSSTWDRDEMTEQLIKAHQNNIQLETDELLTSLLKAPDRSNKVNEIINALKDKNKILVAQKSLTFLLEHVKPADANLSVIAARFYIGQGDNKRALTILSAHEPTIASHADYYSLEAYTLLKLKHFKKSIAIYRSLVSLDPAQPSWWLGLGVDYQGTHQSQQALNAYRMALQYAPAHIAYRYYLTDKINALLAEHS